MTLEERHDFQAWQRTADELTTVERYLGLLAAFAVAEPEVVAEVLAHRPASPPSPESVLDDLARISARPPRGPHAQTRWITSVERVALAHRAAADPRLAVSPQTRELLAQALARFNPGAPVLWVSPLVAIPAVGVEPWTSLRPATETQALCAETVNEDALAAWCEGELHPVDRATLRTWVLTDPWQRAYRALVREGLSDLICMTWTPAWSLDVAHDEGERPSAAMLIDLPLPHLGDGVRLRGRAFVGAVHFEVEGGSSPRSALVRRGDAFHLEDSVVGSIDAKPLFEEPSRLDDAWHGVASVRSLALGNERSSRSLEVAKAVSSSLESGTLLDGLKRAQDVFHSGADEDDESAWALAALEARLALEVLADRLDDPGLDEALERADAAAGPFGNGLLLISDADWQNATHDCEIEPQCWWGVRARLDERVPEQALLECLDDMAGVSEESGTVVPFTKSAKPMPFSAREAGPSLYLAAASRELRDCLFALAGRSEGVEAALEGASARLEAQPCCWLDHRLARAMRAIRHVHGSSYAALVSKLESQLTPAPGQVPLLLVSPDGRGHVLELTIRAAMPGSGSRLDPLFRRTASDAIHRAYQAASSLCAGAVAPRSLYDHEFLVKGGDGFEGIEGDSLALPIALAFLSLWSQTPLPGDLAMTGALFGSTSAGWRVGSVQGVQAKAMALAEEAAGPVRLLVPSGAQVTGDVDDVSVSSLSDAVRASGIVLTLDTVETEAGDAQSMLQSLSRMTSHVKQQDLSEYEGWEEPWKVLAHRMTRMIAALGSRHLDDVIEHRVHAALAWTHAGELDQAKQVLDELPERAEVSPALVCVRKVVELGTAIDEERLSDFAALREEILSIIGELRPFERRGVVGPAYGAMGRSFMHARDPATAQGWFEKSIAHFQATPGLSHEVPRSRTYLVGSLRAQGRWKEAQAELARAFEGIEHAKTESLTYALNTSMFLNYEAARLYIALDQADRALRAAREALVRAELRGFWPRLGILRTMAWAYRLLDEHDEADRCVRVMETMGVSQEHEALRRRLVDEASGSPLEDGEVY